MTEVDEKVPTKGPWDEDIAAILHRNVSAANFYIHIDVVRGLMQSAWQHGYSEAMADSAKMDEKLTNPGQ